MFSSSKRDDLELSLDAETLCVKFSKLGTRAPLGVAGADLVSNFLVPGGIFDSGIYRLDFLVLGVFLKSSCLLWHLSSICLRRVDSLDCVGLVGCGGDSQPPGVSGDVRKRCLRYSARSQ